MRETSEASSFFTHTTPEVVFTGRVHSVHSVQGTLHTHITCATIYSIDRVSLF